MSYINAIGTAVPPYRFQQNEVLSFMLNYMDILNHHEKRWLSHLYHVSGINTRYSAVPDFSTQGNEKMLFKPNHNPSLSERMDIYRQTAPVLGKNAVKECLQQTDKPNDTITHIITISCTGMEAPGWDLDIIEKFGLRPDIHRIHIQFMGCFAAINGLKTANAFCRSDENARVLVICLELCTLHFLKKHDPEQWMSHALFGDGAAACLVENHPGDSGFSIERFKNAIIPGTKQEMGWFPGDHSFEMKLSRNIPTSLYNALPEFINSYFSNIKEDESAWYAIHPGGKKILEATGEALRINKKGLFFSYNMLYQYGNMSSPSILFILEEMKRYFRDENMDQSSVLALAFGPGLAVEAAQLNYYS